jgi:hypothetical protein
MSANIVLKKCIDNRVDPSSAKFAFHDFIVGSSATVWQPFNPTSSSVSTNEFTIQVPGQNSLFSRKVMVKNSTGLQWNVLASVLVQNNTTSSITIPVGTYVYVPYRFGADFSCTAFPFNSLVQTCNTMINGSTINCQASQVMPIIRRVISSAPDIRKRLACPSGITGTSIISNARGTAFDELSSFCPNESGAGPVSNGTFNCIQFYDSKGNPIYTDAACSLPSMASVYDPGAFYGAKGVADSAQALNIYDPSSISINGVPYKNVASGTYKFDSSVHVNGSCVMLAIDIGSTTPYPAASSGGVTVPCLVQQTIPVYASLTTMEPLLFPPFTYSDNEVAFTNVQSANIRMTMLTPGDRMVRLLRNIESVGSRSDIPLSFSGSLSSVLNVIYPSTSSNNNITGFSTLIPQIDSLQYWLGQPGTNSTTSSPFLIQLYTNFLSPSLLEPIPETLVYPFFQYTPLVTSNQTLKPVLLNSISQANFNSTSSSSGILVSNIITLNACPDMLALYIVLDPTTTTTTVSSAQGTITIGSGVTGSNLTITAGTAYSSSNFTVAGTIVVGSTVTISGVVCKITAVTLGSSSKTIASLTFDTGFTVTASQVISVNTPGTLRNPTYSYSDVLACITNVSITWNNNASLLQQFLPSELLEITASNGLPCTQAVGMGVANLPYKANVLNTQGFNINNSASTTGALIYSQNTGNTTPTGTIGCPILLTINKDLPTEAGTAAGVSGVYTLQVTVNTRFVDAGAAGSGNPIQFFVTPIQTQYLQLIRGGTSAIVSAVAAADKMLAAEYTPLRTLQAESPYATGRSTGHLALHHLAGGANHAETLWKRANGVYNAYQAAKPSLHAAYNGDDNAKLAAAFDPKVQALGKELAYGAKEGYDAYKAYSGSGNKRTKINHMPMSSMGMGEPHYG